jgi:GNAT superfamily N-acetyltransferase
MSITLRQADLSDMEELQGVSYRASLSNERDLPLFVAHPEWLVLSDTAVREGRTSVAVDSDGTLVGFATYLVTHDGAELEDLFVDPSHMRCGIGTALVLAISDELRSMNFAIMEVTANSHAMAFYASVGFQPHGVVETEGGPAVRMRRCVV